ncbi:MAG: GIY-YIG nuclease family protein [Bacteroidota bacterium]|nr:GIY-YIG nuclease family protein [Bacteroidota bacterium]
MFYVYSIHSLPKNYTFAGLTDNVERKFLEHQSGRNKTTRPYRPFKIIYAEECSTRQEAQERERYLKPGVRKEYLTSLL